MKKVHKTITLSFDESPSKILSNIKVEGDLHDLIRLLVTGGEQWNDLAGSAFLHIYLMAPSREIVLADFLASAHAADEDMKEQMEKAMKRSRLNEN